MITQKNTEIERKFKLLGNLWKNETIADMFRIQQYYPEVILQVEADEDVAELFIESNADRKKPYWHISIPRSDAEEMLQHCCKEIAKDTAPLSLFTLKKAPRLRKQKNLKTQKTEYLLTIKQGLDQEGACAEWEYEIPAELYEDMALKNLATLSIDKRRNYVEVDGFIFHVDEFFNDKEYVVEELAEAEVKDIDQKIPKPEWLGQEVTGVDDFYNKEIAARIKNL